MRTSYAQDYIILRAYLLLVTLAVKYQKLMPIQFDVLNSDYVKKIQPLSMLGSLNLKVVRTQILQS